MRVTNNMINRTSMTNMNNNKVTVDALNTQMTTQKKINRPSEDPVIAIRALRLRSNLNEINQYYEKNIPDAESWLELTETALNNMKTIVGKVYEQCVYGANDVLEPEDRDAILQNLQALRVQVYKEGNADSAGRTIFTGYKTSSQLTFDADEKDTKYELTEKLSYEGIEEKNYYSNQVTVPTDEASVMVGVPVDKLPQENTHFRLRLSYNNIDSATGIELKGKGGDPLTYKDENGAEHAVNVTTKSYEDWAMGDLLANPPVEPYAVGDDETLFIPETGELIFGKNVSEGLKRDKVEFSATYTKTGFTEGELRPEHYFDCTKTTAVGTVEYVKENQEIAYTVAFNQTIVVNTQASDVFDASIGRDIDELTDIVKGAIAAHEKVAKIEDMMKQEQYAAPEAQEMLGQWLEAAKKEAAYMDDNMQKQYSRAIGTFQGYLDDVNLAVTDVGSKGDRLKLTKNRVSNQQMSFERLKSNNEDRELSNIIIDYTSAYTAYQASLLASSKVNQQTLLNYL